MPQNALSEESYQVMLAAFRRAPGAIEDAAVASGVANRTAWKYWHRGSTTREPIKDTLDRERDTTRAHLEASRLSAEAQVHAAKQLVRTEAESPTLMREIARDALADRERTAIDEGRMVRTARGNVIALLENTRELLAGAVDLRTTLVRKMKSEAGHQPIDVLAKTIQAIGHIAKQGVEAGKTVVEMERLILGEPTSRVAVVFETPSAARREITEAMAAARAAGLIDEHGNVIEVIDAVVLDTDGI